MFIGDAFELVDFAVDTGKELEVRCVGYRIGEPRGDFGVHLRTGKIELQLPLCKEDIEADEGYGPCEENPADHCITPEKNSDDADNSQYGLPHIERGLIGDRLESRRKTVNPLYQCTREVIREEPVRMVLQICKTIIGEILHRAALVILERFYAGPPSNPRDTRYDREKEDRVIRSSFRLARVVEWMGSIASWLKN